MEAKLKEVINKLIDGTKANLLRWEPAERKNQFRITLESGAVAVENWTGSDEDGTPHDIFDIAFMDKAGAEIDTYRASSPAERDLLVVLYSAARRNALKVEEKLAGLFSEIDNKLKIQEATKRGIAVQLADLKSTQTRAGLEIEEINARLAKAAPGAEQWALGLRLGEKTKEFDKTNQLIAELESQIATLERAESK